MSPYAKLLFFLLLFSLPSLSLAQPEEPTTEGSNNLFSLEADQVGLFQNSVNLFTGQVAFSLPLASLSGRGGMTASVALSYSSAGVQQQTKTWNMDAPTSTVGLGWQLDIPRVIVDNKQTGTRTDDTFFLIEGGVSHPLLVVAVDEGVRTLVSENYKFWKIQYEEATETWTITKEDGAQYIYGDKDSDRSTVQYLVKLGNWIGSSNEIVGQQQQAMQWDLSEIRNLFGDAVTFTYEQVLREVAGTGAKKHTEASYLTKITNPQGQSVTLVYKDKTSSYKKGVVEYQDPHTEVREPDVYQERYERRYLDHLEVRDRANTSQFRYSVHLGYATMGPMDQAKRILTSIERRDDQGVRHVSPIEFAYHSGGNTAGQMMLVTTSQGPQIEYEYRVLPYRDQREILT